MTSTKPSSASPHACGATPTTKGCRVLGYVYATSTTATPDSFGDYKGQVQEVLLYSTGKGDSPSTSTSVATYRYESDGRLRQQWNPRLARSTQIQYSYDAAGRVTSYRTATDQPWTLSYGKAGASAAAGDGMLLCFSLVINGTHTPK
ncbi:hypothetical protein [Streptomyces coeruleorubidus]|uniref:hypothetical protein n=1 Tax=Streptomyces coeruleorubidus TaxID=116188 RepID=UPI0037AA064F